MSKLIYFPLASVAFLQSLAILLPGLSNPYLVKYVHCPSFCPTPLFIFNTYSECFPTYPRLYADPLQVDLIKLKPMCPAFYWTSLKLNPKLLLLPNCSCPGMLLIWRIALSSIQYPKKKT